MAKKTPQRSKKFAPPPKADAKPANTAEAIAPSGGSSPAAASNPAAAATRRVRPPRHEPATKAKSPRSKRTSGLDAAASVLASAGKPMRCGEIVERLLTKGLWKTGGKTPAATINAAIIREIRTKRKQSRFRKTGRGLFAAGKAPR